MSYTAEIKNFLKIASSSANPKSVRAIAESIGVSEEEVGLVINQLLKNEDIVKVSEKGCSEGLQYYI